MSFRDRVPKVSWSWNEGKYIDFWSMPHFLSGVLLGLVGYLAPLPFSDAFVLALALLIVYEMWEAWAGLKERLENSVIDVVLAAVGFIGAHRLSEKFLAEGAVLVLAGVLAIGLALLATIGWQAYLKRQQHH